MVYSYSSNINPYPRESHTTYPAAVDSRFQALMFTPLNSDGSNFLKWINDAQIISNAEVLARTFHQFHQAFPPHVLSSVSKETPTVVAEEC